MAKLRFERNGMSSSEELCLEINIWWNNYYISKKKKTHFYLKFDQNFIELRIYRIRYLRSENVEYFKLTKGNFFVK